MKFKFSIIIVIFSDVNLKDDFLQNSGTHFEKKIFLILKEDF